VRSMRGITLGLTAFVVACGGAAPPPPPPPHPPVPVAPEVAERDPSPLSREEVSAAIYGTLFQERTEWRLSGIRHMVTAGDAAGSLHYKVIVRCRVAEVVARPSAIASRVECVNFPEDSAAVNPFDRVWVAGRGGLFRADTMPASEAEWSAVLRGRAVFRNPPEPLEWGDECRERVIDEDDQWCWSQNCPGDPAREGRLCFSKQGALVSVAAHSMAETSDVLALSVVGDSPTQSTESLPHAAAPAEAEASPPPPTESRFDSARDGVE